MLEIATWIHICEAIMTTTSTTMPTDITSLQRNGCSAFYLLYDKVLHLEMNETSSCESYDEEEDFQKYVGTIAPSSEDGDLSDSASDVDDDIVDENTSSISLPFLHMPHHTTQKFLVSTVLELILGRALMLVTVVMKRISLFMRYMMEVTALMVHVNLRKIH